MGAGGSDSSNPFYVVDANKDTELGQLLQQFTFVSIYEDQLFGRCSIIQHKDTKQLIITKDVPCRNQQQMDQLYEEFERRKATLTHNNLLRLRYTIKKKIEGIFNDQYKLILFFDYIVASLLEQYNKRVESQKYFTNQEITIITCGALRGYAALQEQKIPNSKVRLGKIYFGLQSGLPIPKVIDSRLFPSPNNTQLVRKGEHSGDVFLAPEEVKYLEQGNYSNEKSGVYSLGVSILQLCLLVPSRNFYNYNFEKRSINYSEIENRLNIVKNKYPLSIYCLLRDMLERNDDSRPTFTKLAQTLPSNFKNLPATMNISLMKTNKANSSSMSQSKFNMGSSTMSKVVNPLMNSRTKKPPGSLASQYRPQIDVCEVYTNGNRYQGQKKENMRHGRGRYIYNDGSYYMGSWVRGKMQGQGQLYDYQGNLVYDGNWRDDHYQGNGRLMGVGTDWVKYQGEFRSGLMEGFGEMWFNDGKRYKGQFRNDMPDGKGRMFSRNGEVQNGVWDRGNFVSSY